MESAALTGHRHHRSATEQVEYWAALGKQVASTLNPDSLLDVLSGLAILKIEPIVSVAVDPDQAFATLDNERKSGGLDQAVSSAALRYQACPNKPGWLEQISADGDRKLGRFCDGVFQPLSDYASTGEE